MALKISYIKELKSWRGEILKSLPKSTKETPGVAPFLLCSIKSLLDCPSKQTFKLLRRIAIRDKFRTLSNICDKVFLRKLFFRLTDICQAHLMHLWLLSENYTKQVTGVF